MHSYRKENICSHNLFKLQIMVSTSNHLILSFLVRYTTKFTNIRLLISINFLSQEKGVNYEEIFLNILLSNRKLRAYECVES